MSKLVIATFLMVVGALYSFVIPSKPTVACYCVGVKKTMPNGKSERWNQRVCDKEGCTGLSCGHNACVRNLQKEMDRLYEGTGITVEVWTVADHFCD